MIQLSLNTPAERAASLRALTVYVNALDALSPSGAATAAAFASVASAANDVVETQRSIRQSATALPPMHLPRSEVVTCHAADLPGYVAGAAVIPAADVPDVGAPLPVAVSAPDLTAEQVFGMAPMTAQQAADALNGQHCRPAVPAPVAPTVELDAEGKPWDPELHASSKAKIGDGTWRKKRNAAPVVPTPPAVPAAATPVVPTPPVPASVAPTLTAADVTKEMIGAMMAQKIDGPSINALCAAHGVPSFLALQQHPDKIAAVMAAFREKVPA
jgi:hypothetical protein